MVSTADRFRHVPASPRRRPDWNVSWTDAGPAVPGREATSGAATSRPATSRPATSVRSRRCLIASCTTYGSLYGMEKTTVYLTIEQRRALARAARATGRSEAQLIREGVDRVTEPHRVAEPQLPLFDSQSGDVAEREEEFLRGFGER